MVTLDNTRPVWAEINLDNLAHNIREVRKVTSKDAMITAVVKADAYGHGSIIAAKTFLENGGDRLAVATLSEAIQLRRAGIDVPLLILGYTPVYQMDKVLENNIIQTVYNYDQALALSGVAKELGEVAKIHIKLDTGMSRIGLRISEESLSEIVKISKLSNIEIEGMFTHFAVADEKDKTTTSKQFEGFKWMLDRLSKENINIPVKHVSNSAATIDIPEYNLDMVRAGIMLYGLYPSDEVEKNRVDLKPAMTLKARISHIKTLDKGVGISYGHIYTTDKKSRIATLPIGYADGYTRMLTGKAEVGIKGARAPIVGKICMDQCMIDVTHIENVKIGDEVILFGDGRENSPHIDEIAKSLGTINYEIVCMVNKRVPRVYVKNGEIVSIVDYLLD